MRSGLLILGLAGVLVLAADEPPKAIPLVDVDALKPDEGEAPLEIGEPQVFPGVPQRGRVESASRQFGVSGGTAELRGSLALRAEEVRREFHGLLGLGEEDPTMPIEIILHGQAGDEPRARELALELRFTQETYLLNLHLDLARGIDHARLHRALLRGLLYQRALKGVRPGGLEGALQAPAWLVEGMLEAGKWRAGVGDRRLYEGVFESRAGLGVDEVLTISDDAHARLDGVSREMFRALSGALVMALLEQPDGRRSLASFCGEVARFQGEMPILLRQHFPGLNLSEKSLVKWWALTLAKLADAPLTESMGIAATERELERALVLRFEIDGLPRQARFDSRGEAEALEEPERLAAVRPAQQSLNRLSYRCFPSYRPLLLEYQQWLVAWASGEDAAKLDAQLVELAETRAIMEARATRARDYLDYLEIAGATELSGSFDDYLRLKRELAERPRVEKTDAISGYLDRLDAVYQAKSSR